MALEDQPNPSGVRPPSPTSAVRIVPARVRAASQPEFRRADGWLEVTLDAPDIVQTRFRYAVGKRYLLAWSGDSPHEQPHFVLLPSDVDPDESRVTFVNGVVDARLRLKRAPQPG